MIHTQSTSTDVTELHANQTLGYTKSIVKKEVIKFLEHLWWEDQLEN